MQSNAELLELYKSGDEKAYNEIVEKNMGLVYSVVKRFMNRGCEYDDLVQLGSIGLVKAVQKFDTSFGVQFSTYAVPMIIGEIKRFLRDDGAIKISRSIKEIAVKGRHAEERLRIRMGRNPTIREISAECGVEQESLLQAFDAMNAVQSLDGAVSSADERDVKLIERIVSEDTEEKIVDKVYLKNALSKLNEKERKIIQLRYFKRCTQSEIAENIGVSQVQISRIEKRALKKLREDAVL